MIDKYAAFYTPTILMLAIITWWLSNGDMERVITLLVIACPCAVVLATPTTVVASVAAAARLGILVKNVSHLVELASRIRAFVFDKTGTLTEGQLAVAKLGPVDGVEPAELLMIASSIEAHSNHPTALALQKLAKEVGIQPQQVANFKETPGTGVEGTLNGKVTLVGRAIWLKAFHIALPEAHGGIHRDERGLCRAGWEADRLDRIPR